MLIREKIIEAKSIMGVEAAYMIAKDLSIEHWDETSLKGCCPFHEEKTPSFIWNKEGNYFKCFGCGRVYGILDHYQQYYKLSYIDSVKRLFEETNLNEDFEFDFKEKDYFKNYRYPKEEINTDRRKVEEYMAKRKISIETLDFAGIKQDKNGNIVFEHRDENGKLLAVKYRPARKIKKSETKSWWQKHASTCPILYGVDKIDITQSLLIVEGHIDRLACIEAGFKNTVSIPHGANNYSWIEFNWEWLENFDKIIIWADDDEAGQKMIKEVVPRLGEHRCYVVEIPQYVRDEVYKTFHKVDANNVLYSIGKEEVMKLILNAKETPVEDIVDLMSCEDFDISQAEKISTGFNKLDKRIYSHIMGSFNIWTGYTGHGKSTIIIQSCILEPLEQGYEVFLFSGELMKSQLKNWIQTPLAGHNHIIELDNGKYRPKTYKATKEAKEKIEEYYKGKIHLYDNFLKSKPEDILNKMLYLFKKNGVKVFVIDNLMCVDFSEREDKWDAQKDFIMKLIDFTVRYGVIIHLVAHPRKPNGFVELTEYDIFGSSNIPNLTHRIFSIRRVSEREKEGVANKKGEYVQEPIPYDAILTVLKDRITGAKDYNIGLHFDYKSKRYYGNSDNLYRKYKWDNGSIKYNNDIKSKLIINKSDENEVLGSV